MAEPIRDKVSAEDLQALLADDKREWLEAIDAIHAEFGEAGVREILRNVQDHVLSRNVALDEATLNTPYINTIAPEDQPIYPGDVEMEERIEQILRWNAIAMVLQAQDKGIGAAAISRLTPPARLCWRLVSTTSFVVLGRIMIVVQQICCCLSLMLRRVFTLGRFWKAACL